MEPDKIAAEIERLTISQKLILAQDIWDSIARESGRLPMPQWQKKELEKRYSRYEQGKTADIFISDADRQKHLVLFRAGDQS